MHEMSLCQGIFDSVVPVAKANGATKITEITLTIGDMTMVVPEAMEFAFEALSEDDPRQAHDELRHPKIALPRLR